MQATKVSSAKRFNQLLPACKRDQVMYVKRTRALRCSLRPPGDEGDVVASPDVALLIRGYRMLWEDHFGPDINDAQCRQSCLKRCISYEYHKVQRLECELFATTCSLD